MADKQKAFIVGLVVIAVLSIAYMVYKKTDHFAPRTEDENPNYITKLPSF